MSDGDYEREHPRYPGVPLTPELVTALATAPLDEWYTAADGRMILVHERPSADRLDELAAEAAAHWPDANMTDGCASPEDA